MSSWNDLSVAAFFLFFTNLEKDMERVAVVVITRVEAKLESRFMHNWSTKQMGF